MIDYETAFGSHEVEKEIRAISLRLYEKMNQKEPLLRADRLREPIADETSDSFSLDCCCWDKP